MRKKVILFALPSLLISLCIPASSQEVDIKCVADTEFVSDLYFHLNDTVTMPIGQAELDRVGHVLLKLPGVSMDDNGDVFIDYRYKTKVSKVYFNGDKEIKFICPDYSLVLLPPGPLDPNIKAVIAKMDGKGSRPLTPEEMREYGLIGIPIPLPEGETVESYLLKQPGVHKDEEGNVIYPNGRVQTSDDIKQIEQFVHVSLQDSLLKLDGIENKKTDHIEIIKDDYIEIIDEYCGDIPHDSLRYKDGVYLVVPEGPDYPGGPSALFDFINNTMVYPAQALKESIQGRVIVQFIVEEDGSITNPVVVKSSGQNRNQAYSNIFNQLDAEALRIISVMPKWNPGKVEGKPCRVRYNLPINFRIEG